MTRILAFFLAFISFGFLFSPGNSAGRMLPIPEEEKMPISLPMPDRALPDIKVLIHTGKTVTVGFPSFINVYDGKSGAFLTTTSISPLTISVDQNAFIINDETYRNPTITIAGGTGPYTLGDCAYAGKLNLRRGDGMAYVVNDVDLETYVKGVLPAEMFSKWPAEALKAQAVAARTYAVFSACYHAQDFYHVVSTTASQVYKGAGVRVPSTDAAVDATKGEILHYGNEIFPAYFHSTCGGHTSSVNEVWDQNPFPTLTGVYCPFCADSPHYRWQNAVSCAEVSTRLMKNGYSDETIKNIEIARDDGAGRVTWLRLIGMSETTVFRANDIRIFVLPDILKSTFFTITSDGTTFHIHGFGWGHGVGLCQWGARKMAEDGYDYRAILGFYYQSSRLVKYLPPVTAEDAASYE